MASGNHHPAQSAATANASSAENRRTIGSTCSAYRHPGETVTDVAQRLLAQHRGLRGWFRMDLAELARVRRPGDAKAARLKAALAAGWRRLAALEQVQLHLMRVAAMER
jgi:hypothetical protein